MIIGKYPSLRLRRSRKYDWSRRLIEENNLTPNDFILPLFLIDGKNKKVSIKSMPGVYRYSLDKISFVVDKAIKKGLPMIALFPYTSKNKKNLIEDKVLADSCEALIGSVYLDKGFTVVEKFILDLWSENIKDSIITQIDAKTKLQELSLHKFKKLPIYKLISNTGPRHKPLFKVGVKLIDTKFYIAQGKSKKDAEQNAAIICLKDIKK